jgi:hypothetical protein
MTPNLFTFNQLKVNPSKSKTNRFVVTNKICNLKSVEKQAAIKPF